MGLPVVTPSIPSAPLPRLVLPGLSSVSQSMRLVVHILTATGSPGTAPIGYLGIHGIADGPDNGRGMRDMFIANNGCAGEENPEPGSGSLSHVKSEYTCDGPPVGWITFVSQVPSPQDCMFADLQCRTAAIPLLPTMVARETTGRRPSSLPRPGSSSASSSGVAYVADPSSVKVQVIHLKISNLSFKKFIASRA